MKNSRKSHTAEVPAKPGRLLVELAGFRRRVASLVYESLLLAGVLALTFLVPNLILGVIWSVTPPGWLMWIHVFAVLGAYFIWYWTRNGQTLAMQTWRLKIVTASEGTPPRAPTAWLRYLLAWPSVLSFGLGLAWALVDRDRQFLHDRLAGTRVVLLPDPAGGNR
ncbi:MAG TPA: RDD family protein [Rhodocyclaceae bacterium]|nr:RDD family protein [Rhodocyclaceae bacterium]